MTRFILAVACNLAAHAEPGQAKPRYLDQVRVALISRTASCTACHATPDGKKLNAYGDRIATRPKNLPMADRIARLEREKDDPASKDRDVDQDGVPNWVEILAQNNPADAKETPDEKTTERIKTVVSCHICHRETGLPGEGLAANPHNALGELLAKSVRPVTNKPKPKGDHDLREAAERIPILSRIEMIRTKKPKGSAATYWQKLRMFHAPVDTNDNPSTQEVKDFKRAVTTKNREKKPRMSGLGCAAHPVDGFLLDGERLE